VRLFVYQIEAFHKPSPEKEILGAQFKIMTKRLWYIISWPSMILAIGFAIWLLVLRPFYLTDAWMQVKLGFVLLLIIYHIKCHIFFKQLQNDVVKHSSNFMRLFNEGATMLLFAIVFLAVLKNAVNWIYGVIGIVLFSVLIMLGYKFYKRIREK
jgi:putative membrane protein